MLPRSGWLAGIFFFFIRMGAPGLFLLGTLDSSFLTLPFANDLAVVMLVSFHHEQLPLYVAAATLGSLVGCAIMFVIGHWGGETLIRANISPARFAAMQAKTRSKGPVLLAVPAIIPPPFPFSAWVLAAGALEVPWKRFLAMLAAMRCCRFLLEAIAALYIGRRVVRWMNTPAFRYTIDVLVIAAIAASAWSVYKLVITTRKARGGRPRGAANRRRPELRKAG